MLIDVLIFIIGVFVGVCIGILLIALVSAGGKDDRE